MAPIYHGKKVEYCEECGDAICDGDPVSYGADGCYCEACADGGDLENECCHADTLLDDPEDYFPFIPEDNQPWIP